MGNVDEKKDKSLLLREKNYTIPKEWEVVKLEDLSVDGIKNGVFNNPQKIGRGVKLINVVNLYSGSSIDTNNLTLLDLSQEEINKYRVKVGDIFFTRSSLKLEGIAQCNINIDDKSILVFDDHVMRVSPNKEKVVPYYLKEFCLSNYSRRFFMRYSKTTTMTTIGQKDVGKLPVFLPPYNEQLEIAKIFNLWNKAIDLKEEFINMKKEKKRGLTQKLLTGELKFPGFPEVWSNKKVEDLIVESKEIARNPDLTKKITVKLNLKGIEERGFSSIEKEGATTQYLRKKGQFIYGKQNLHKGAFGIIPEELDGYQSSSDIPAFDFKKGVDPYWFYYYFARESYYKSLERLSTGTGSKRINPKEFLKLSIKVPSLAEQKAISKVLLTADKEIDLLTKELSELKLQKKGLMQLLLTGKVRVKV